MFLNLDQKPEEAFAIRDDSGHTLTYGQLTEEIDAICALDLPRCVAFCLCESCAGALTGYLAFESCGVVPLLLNAALDAGLRDRLEQTYRPAYYWAPAAVAETLEGETVYRTLDYVLLKTVYEPYPLNPTLSLLLTTSGSTGSPKLVRHKYGNLEANAENVAKIFGWTPADVGICDLPMHYTMGLNVINTHLIVGACVLMVKANLMDPAFWSFIREYGGTSFCGVPFSYEIMRRIGFDKMDLPALKTLAEGGGKLTDKMFQWLANDCAAKGRRFCATFGTSETSARMAFLDPALAQVKTGSIGKAIPPGELFLTDETVHEDGTADGELCFRGPNVTMGYAECAADLQKGDEFCGEYHTGDLAKRDADGFYYIVGRKKRFLKLFGMRVSLDETERILRSEYGQDFVCVGDDRKMRVFTTDASLKDLIVPFLSEKTKLHNSAFTALVIDEIPRNEYGKVRFSVLEEAAGLR